MPFSRLKGVAEGTGKINRVDMFSLRMYLKNRIYCNNLSTWKWYSQTHLHSSVEHHIWHIMSSWHKTIYVFCTHLAKRVYIYTF